MVVDVEAVWIIAGLAAFGLSFGLCLVGYAIISRWPTSPQHLANGVRDVQSDQERLRAEWQAEKEAIEDIIDTLRVRADRVSQAARRQERATEKETPADPLADQMNQLAGASGVLARAGRH